ncbi:type II-A CRISPR-associated protein Csn2 [Lactobacillus sp. ESL0701]|uniref:type II-A CRISPR-associated protein Csn2 n=1 Tax=Lactobacillus sp. ESL0701 TaxID=2983217 RepID=UPI0023F8A40A|nr:type II-A CRISPR-associated protein Csn2 [Lactobacillus sp. ESL0701]MDF7672719.1 type II-A CRISPR-associated protein Csn2 [Lactobacillus sp. ESL0701]
MILSYLTHKKWTFKDNGLTILATQSPIVFQDLIQSFQGNKKMLICTDDSYQSLELEKVFDFVGDVLLSGDVTKKYMLHIEKSYITNLDEDNRNKIFVAFNNLETVLQDSLLLEDLPLDINFDEDLKKLIKMTELHLDSKIKLEPYAIIETVLKIHQICNIKTIPVICNVAHYLDEQKMQELYELVKQVNIPLILIEFTSPDLLIVPKNVQFYYIDKDLIDWY